MNLVLSISPLPSLFVLYSVRTGSSYPHIVDVDWRLDYYIKVRLACLWVLHTVAVNKLEYQISISLTE